MKTCTGCGKQFHKTHRLMDHRRTFRCGGEYNPTVWATIPDGWYEDAIIDPETGAMKIGIIFIDVSRPGTKYYPGVTLPDTQRALSSTIRRIRKKNTPKGRVPGTIRKSRMPGGSGYRGDKLWEMKDVA